MYTQQQHDAFKAASRHGILTSLYKFIIFYAHTPTSVECVSDGWAPLSALAKSFTFIARLNPFYVFEIVYAIRSTRPDSRSHPLFFAFSWGGFEATKICVLA